MRHVTVLLLLSVAWVGVQTHDKCKTTGSKDFHFSIGNHKNASGHHIITADFLSASDNATTLEVETATVPCGDYRIETVKVVATRQPAAQVKIPSGYERVPGIGVYKVHSEKKDFVAAFDACLSEGAHLMIINSKAEADLVPVLCSKASCSNYMWQGFHDQFKEGYYVTVTGQLLSEVGYENWAHHQPDGDNDDCGCMHSSGERCDAICRDLIAFICEFE